MKSRLVVGIDVPWVTSWSQEEINGVGACSSVDGEVAVLQSELPQYGRPIYSKNHFRRQRESIHRMLCPMCGRPTESGDRWSQTGKFFPAGILRARGLGVSIPSSVEDRQIILDSGGISPGHLACMSRALLQCPHLNALEDRELKPFPERWHVTATLLNATITTASQGIHPEASQVVTAIGFLQLSGLCERTDPMWRDTLI